MGFLRVKKKVPREQASALGVCWFGVSFIKIFEPIDQWVSEREGGRAPKCVVFFLHILLFNL